MPGRKDTIFKISRCQKSLTSNGINIVNIITSNDTKMFNKKINATVAITAIQLSLVDILTSLGIKPTYLMSESIGVLACAYADNCLSLKQAILCAQIIGQAKNDLKKDEDMIKDLRQVISSPKDRSSKWLTGLNSTKGLTAEFLIESFSDDLLFKILLDKIILLEISPCGHLKKDNTIVLPLLKKNACDPVEMFSKVLGELYLKGFNFDIFLLYPEINYPVSRQTPMVSPLIKWDHRQDFFVLNLERLNSINTIKRQQHLDIKLIDEDFKYISGHIVDGNKGFILFFSGGLLSFFIVGRILLPGTGYLVLIWKGFASIKRVKPQDMNIVFENVRFLRATQFTEKKHNANFQFTISVCGYFEVSPGIILVRGFFCFINFFGR